MLNALRTGGRPRLLVSVRGVEESQAAFAGGADVIDVKEPSRGSLGAADAESIAAVVAAVGQRVPTSAALGELVDFLNGSAAVEASLLPGVAYYKLGLASCARLSDWPERWRHVAKVARGARPVAVAYADWRAADAPPPQDVLAAADAAGCPALLIDTWNKNAGDLFDHWPMEPLEEFARRAQSQGMAIVLAGSLSAETLARAVAIRPDVVAVRGAVCEGGRNGRVSRRRVAALREALETATQASVTCGR